MWYLALRAPSVGTRTLTLGCGASVSTWHRGGAVSDARYARSALGMNLVQAASSMSQSAPGSVDDGCFFS